VAERFAAACRQGVLVAAGPGNNGGDGWVIARALHAVGVPVWVAPAEAPGSELCILQARLAREDGVREVSPDGPWPAAGVLVDALLGTGASGAPRGAVGVLAQRLAELDLPLVAVDGPTGLDLRDGVNHGPLRARLTLTFGGYRRGHLLARDDCGDLIALDIGFPPPVSGWPLLVTADDAARQVHSLAANAHKGGRGRVVIVGGDAGMPGAARLAARAAFGAGAGLVHLVAPAATVQALTGMEPDVQFAEQNFAGELEGTVRTLLGRADAVVIGPGLGRSIDRGDFVLALLAATRAPVVLDADGLVAVQGRLDELAAAGGGRVVLTPHLGEFRALWPALATDASVDPWGAAAAAAGQLSATVLLKGVPTVVATPGRVLHTIAAGNPGLATGGSGDCLAGMIAALLGQGVGPAQAAVAGAQALGEAADLAARRQGARALRPMDVVAALPELWRLWGRRVDQGVTRRPPVLHELPRPEAR
jgi:NAD(P)H-hydrate epimerase